MRRIRDPGMQVKRVAVCVYACLCVCVCVYGWVCVSQYLSVVCDPMIVHGPHFYEWAVGRRILAGWRVGENIL